MKIYSCPKQFPAPTPDYSNYNRAKEEKAEIDHIAQLKEHFIACGYNGKYTGKIYREGVADGYAVYMVVDGPKSFLIHLPYGDGYTAQNVQFLPKKEIIRRIDAQENFNRMFRKA